MISAGDVATAALWVTNRESGTFTSDPYPSKWGISLQYHPNLTLADVQGMTQQRAAEIFAAKYWLAEWNGLPQFLATPMLAFSVLEGPMQTAQCLQRALVVHVDGDVGAQTINAARLPKPDDLLESFFGACMDRLHESPTWIRDGTGWERRQMRASLAAVS